MTRLLIIIIALVVAAGTVGFVILGAFPQHVTRTPVEHTLPADRLGHS